MSTSSTKSKKGQKIKIICPFCYNELTQKEIIQGAGVGFDPRLKELHCPYCRRDFFVLLSPRRIEIWRASRPL